MAGRAHLADSTRDMVVLALALRRELWSTHAGSVITVVCTWRMAAPMTRPDDTTAPIRYLAGSMAVPTVSSVEERTILSRMHHNIVLHVIVFKGQEVGTCVGADALRGDMELGGLGI